MLKLDLLNNTNVNSIPFDYLILDDFIDSSSLDLARKDYPVVPGPGSHPPSGLKIEGKFKQLIDEILGDPFREIIERKFNLKLSDFPTMYTVRGFCRLRDGKIHTDSVSKIITVLLYMNDDDWSSDGGCLRLLNNSSDLENYFLEVKPTGGTLLVFKRSENSWHGHHSFEGQRRAIQLNWVLDDSVVEREQERHGFSSRFKRLINRK